MNTPRRVSTLALLVLLLLVNHPILKGQSVYENPWGGSMPARTDSLAYERSPVEGFAWPTSVLPGETITFYVSVMNLPPEGQTYKMKIFRSPNWADGQELYVFTDTTGHFYPLRAADGDSIFPWETPTKRPIDYRIGCKDYWSPTARTYTAPGTSGLYFARLNHLSINAESSYYYIPFIVRASHPGDSSKILFKYDWNTLQAYNYWGGGSLYSTGQDIVTLTPDSIIRFDRPLRRDFGRWITYVSALERTLLENGYSMEYCNNIDVDRDTTLSLLSHYNVLVLWNHDEYWSFDERQNTRRFKGELQSGLHGNIARFSANTCYWRITWDSTGDGKYLRLKCRKNNYGLLPYDLWRFPADSGGAGMPEAQLLGSQYQTGGNDVDLYPGTEQPPDSVWHPSHWIFRNAQLTTVGQEFGFGIIQRGKRRGLVSGEVDNTLTYNFEYPTLDTLAQRFVKSLILPDTIPQNVLHQMIYYEDTASNARVFGSGAIGGGWTYCLITDSGSVPDDVVRMKTITMNIISHFSGKKYIGKVWTGNPLFPLTWQTPIELDGNVQIPQGKYLRAISNTITIDSTFAIDGTLEINGNVTITGPGQVIVGATGNILLASGSTLKIKTTVQTADSVIISVPSATILRIDTLGKIYFGTGSRIDVSGTFIAQGTAASPIILTRSTTNNDYWLGITLNVFASAAISHCNILHAQVGVNANTVQPSISYSTFDSSKIGISLFESAGEITNSIFTNCIIKGIIIDGEFDYIEPSAVPLLTDNIISSNTTGLYITNSAPILERNTIEDHAQYGIACVNNGNAFVSRNEIDAPGCNVLNSNGTANLFVDNASPFLGYADERIDGIYGGYNSFGPEKYKYDVWAQNESAVIARKNYWSEYPPEEESELAVVARLLLEATANRTAVTSPAVNKRLTIAGEVELQPSHFALHQNYPNPFNPSTTIAFDLPAAGFVSLKLSDILGREVLNLINEHRDAGYHQINMSTTQLSSGVYFCRFETHGFTSVKKMLAIK